MQDQVGEAVSRIDKETAEITEVPFLPGVSHPLIEPTPPKINLWDAMRMEEAGLPLPFVVDVKSLIGVSILGLHIGFATFASCGSLEFALMIFLALQN